MGTARLAVDGATLYVEVAGPEDAQAVLLAHDGGMDSRMWDRQFDALAGRYRTIRYDLRGFGRSDRPTAPYSEAEDLVAVLRASGVERAALVGLSMGGRIAVEAALAHPEAVLALVLTAPGLHRHFDFEDAELDARWEVVSAIVKKAVAAGDLHRAVDAELDFWAPVPTSPEGELTLRRIAHDNAHEQLLDDSLRRDIDPPVLGRLGEVDVPTLVMVGDRDISLMLALARHVADGIRGARLELLPGADHMANLRDPERFNRSLLAFLDEVLA